MSPTAFAAILLRLLAAWLILHALLQVADGLLLIWANHVSARQIDWSLLPKAPAPGQAMYYFHDTYYRVESGRSAFGLGLRIIMGLLVFTFSKRLAALFACRIERE